MRWDPDAGVLAHLINGVLPKTPFWDKLQHKEWKSMSEFYKKASKFKKLENSREALHKAHEASTNKKNDQGEKIKNMKGSEKRRADEKRGNSPKMPRNEIIDHKASLLKYTNYHTLNALQDHIYAVSDKNMFKN